MYYVNYDEESGEILGIYPVSYEYEDVPEPKIEISEADWERLGEGYWLVEKGKLVQAVYTDGEGWHTGNSGSDDTDGDSSVLQSEYASKFESLQNAYTGALILNDTGMLGDIKRDYKRLLEEFREIQFEDEPEDSEHEHCEICGTILHGGECPKCHWRQ